MICSDSSDSSDSSDNSKSLQEILLIEDSNDQCSICLDNYFTGTKENLLKLKEADPFIRGLVPWTGFKQIPIEYARDERRSGKTSYSLKKMLNLTLDGMLSFSNFPLKISYYICIISVLILFLLVVYTLKSYIEGQTVPGWTSLIIIILFFNSILFFILGIFGEYLGRIFLEIKKRPNVIISEITED